MKTFLHRCPAANEAGEETCHVTQRWSSGGREASACTTCGFVPGVPWQREMAGKMGIEVDDEPVPESGKDGG